jgi:hypothetical protein
MIALADIGRIAADAFAKHAEFIGTKIRIAGDELTVRQIADVFTAVDGTPQLPQTEVDRGTAGPGSSGPAPKLSDEQLARLKARLASGHGQVSAPSSTAFGSTSPARRSPGHSFESDLGGWAVCGLLPGSPDNPVDWTRSRQAYDSAP